VYGKGSDNANLLDDLIGNSTYLLLVVTAVDEGFHVGSCAFGEGHEIADGQTIAIFLVLRMHLKSKIKGLSRRNTKINYRF